MANEYEVAFKIFSELRQEVLASQRIRAQIIGVKITFIGTAIGFIIHNDNGIFIRPFTSAPGEIAHMSGALLVIPAIAAIFFDFLIISYGFSIKRIGFYCRAFLEEEIRAVCGISKDFIFWQQFLEDRKTRQKLGHIGNFGTTALAMAAAVIGLIQTNQTWLTVSGITIMVIGSGLSIWACCTPNVFIKDNFPVEVLSKTSISRTGGGGPMATPTIVATMSAKPTTTTTVTTTTTTTT